MTDLVEYESHGRVATISLNRPAALNAVTSQMRTDLQGHLDRVATDPTVDVVVVTGRGGNFSAGADIREAQGDTSVAAPFWDDPVLHALDRGTLYKPVVAAVDGYCLGFGMLLVALCDFIVATDRAQFGMPEVRIGVPALAGAAALPRRVGWTHAMELLLTGDHINAERGREIGLVGRVVPASDLDTEVAALVGRLQQGDARAAAAIKEMALRTQLMSFQDAIPIGAELHQRFMLSEAQAPRPHPA